AEQQLGERDAHLPPAGKRLRRTLRVVRVEAEAAQDRRNPQVHAVALGEPEAILQLAVARQHRVVLVLRNRCVAEPVLDVVHLGFHVEQRLKRAARLFEDRPPRVRQPVLRQIADGQARRLDDGTFVRLVDAREHLEHGRLAGAVGAAQADAIAVRDLPRDVIDQGAVAERLTEVGKLDHAAGAPSAFDAAASTCGTLNGLVRYPATPRFTASMALDSVEKPVMMMTGRSALMRLAWRISVRPSMPGIFRSAISRS